MNMNTHEVDLPDIDKPDQVSVEWLGADLAQCFITFKPINATISISLLAPAARSLRDALDAYLKDIGA